MKIFKEFLLAIVVIIVVAGCSQEGFKTTDTGLKYKIHTKFDGKQPVIGDLITVSMEYGPKDSILFSTYNLSNPQMKFQCSEPMFDGDFFEGILLMSEGDSATFVLSADSFFLKASPNRMLPPYIKPGSDLYFNVKLHKVQTPAEAQQEEEAELDKLMEKEGIVLNEFLNANNITEIPGEDGTYFLLKEKGSNRKLREGMFVSVHYETGVIQDGKLIPVFNTRERGTPVEFELGKPYESEGFINNIAKLNNKGKARFIVPSDKGFGRTGRGRRIPPHSTLVYDVEIVDVFTKEQYDAVREQRQKEEQTRLQQMQQGELAELDKYLKDNNITTQPTESGVYYVEINKGDGPKPVAGNRVKVHYTLRLLNGKKIDSSHDRNAPFEFNLGRGEVIKGWDEGIALMNVGDTGMLIIPSEMGYGSRGAGRDIPPYSSLIFEVALLEIVN